MQIGISLSVNKFKEEKGVLGNLVDFIEIILTGKEAISGLGCKCKLFAHLAEFDRMCFDSLEVAKGLGADKAVVHFFTRSQIAFDKKLTILDKLRKKAVDEGITLYLENVRESVDLLETIFERIPELQFCLDVGHANLFSKNPVDFLDAFRDRLEHIHIHDNRGGYSEEDDLHLPPGEGTIDFQRIFSKLKAMKYDKTMTLELHPHFDPNIKAESLRQLRRKLE